MYRKTFHCLKTQKNFMKHLSIKEIETLDDFAAVDNSIAKEGYWKNRKIISEVTASGTIL